MSPLRILDSRDWLEVAREPWSVVTSRLGFVAPTTLTRSALRSNAGVIAVDVGLFDKGTERDHVALARRTRSGGGDRDSVC